MQVLLIDDDGDDRQLAALLLRNGLPGATITEVGDAAGYAEFLGRDACDVVIASAGTAWAEGAALLAFPEVFLYVGGRQGKLYYGTQVATRPPSFTLFVNDPKLFGETYRRYVERQIREGLGFEGSPIRLFWRGKQQRDAERDLARQGSRGR